MANKYHQEKPEIDVPVPVKREKRDQELRMTKQEFLSRAMSLESRGRTEPIVVFLTDTGTRWVSFAAYQKVGQNG